MMEYHGTFKGSLADLLKNLPTVIKGIIQENSKPMDYSEEAAEAAAKRVDWAHEAFRMRCYEYYTNPTKENYSRILRGKTA